MNPATVLVVGGDPLLLQVIRYLLPHPAPIVLTASSLDEALAQTSVQVPGQQPPRMVVVDLPHGEEGTNLLFQLRAHLGPVPLIVLASGSDALAGLPPEWLGGPRVLSRPPDIAALRSAFLEIQQQSEEAGAPAASRWRFLGRAAGLVAGLVVVVIGLLLILPSLGVPYIPKVLEWVVARPPAAPQPPATTIHLQSSDPNSPDFSTFRLEEDAARAMKIPNAPFRIGPDPVRRQLTLSGSLAFDPDRLGRVQSRFQGEVISIAESTDPSIGPKGSKESTLTYGNRVKKGQLMAVIWSKDLGEKKSELVDWLVKLSLDSENLKRVEALWADLSVPEATYRAAKNAVSADLNGIARARRTLETWKVTPEEIKKIEEEAARILSSKNLRDLNKLKANIGKWARVEVVAPFDGVIVEKNLAVGNMVDPTQDLFRVADMRKLAVFANAYEEDQRLLQDMQAKRGLALPIPWRVHLTSDPEKEALDSEGIERIGYIVDPQQRTNLAIGKVENKNERLRVGQSVTAVVDVNAPKGVVAIPASALVEDGADSVVFVQPDPKKRVYVMKRVAVVQRFNAPALEEARLLQVTNSGQKTLLVDINGRRREFAVGPEVRFIGPGGGRTTIDDPLLQPHTLVGLVLDGEKLHQVYLPPFLKREPREFAYVRSVLTPRQKKAGLVELAPGERVLASAVVELKAALEEVQARARREHEEKEKAKQN
jgi:cobalt-zinc-cadmium efflux system membrane fusion protein